MAQSEFLHEAGARGFLFQCTDAEALDARLCAARARGYIGFDCTADSLHVGSLVQIMLLRLFARTGHQPVVLLGGGTTRIGDPSGKDSARQMLTDAAIAANMAGIRRVFEPFLDFGDNAALLVNNADWLDRLGYIDLLRDVGAHFSVNRMLGFDSIRLRLEREQPLSFLEFNYMILQSYDFRELHRRHGVVLQMGGSDQWGNIVSGVELVRRTEGAQVFGLTAPLLTTASGAKMGKTAQGAVWLSADKLSPYDYWQFWRNTEDADVGRFLRLFTDLPLDDIARLEALGGAEINAAKKILATEATTLAHGAAAAQAAAEVAARVFEAGVVVAGVMEPRGVAVGLAAPARVFEAGEGAAALPTVSLPEATLAAGVPAFALLVLAGLAASNGEARRLIRSGGARLNDAPITEETQPIGLADLHDGTLKLSAGRKQHRLVRPSPH
jgi:tyrosyl-tRNA synthetase